MAEKNNRAPIGLIAVIVIVIAGFWAIDIFLERTEARETEAEAQGYYQTGAALLKAGNAAEAVDSLSKAHALDRENLAFEMDLAEALLESGKQSEAADMLGEILERVPNDGRANLLEARLMLKSGDFQQAEAYYHRAIFGIWGGDAEKSRTDARLELAAVLDKRGDKQELLAELLGFTPQEMENRDVEEKVAAWYLDAGAPQRAAAVYKSLMAENPGEKTAAKGYAESELAMGNYRLAETAFSKAGEDGRAFMAGEVAALDPTVRTLSAGEKFRRSQRVLEMMRDTLAGCKGDQKLVDEANALLDKKERGPVTNEMAEDRLSLAEDLWDARPQGCQADEVLRLVMKKVTAE